MQILSASVVHLGGVSMDGPMAEAEWSRAERLRNFSIVRKMDGHAWPMGACMCV